MLYVHICVINKSFVTLKFYGLIWCKIFIESLRFDSLQWLQSKMINKKQREETLPIAITVLLYMLCCLTATRWPELPTFLTLRLIG